MAVTKPKKQTILEAAARLFRDKGYSATSMRDLAQAVDLKASSLYNHISSKEEILQKICFNNAHRFLNGMKEVEEKDVSPTEKIRSLIRFHIIMATEDVTSVTAFNDEWRHLSEPHLNEFLALRKDYELRFKAIIKEGIASSEFRPIKSSIVLHTFLSSIRWLYDWYQDGREISTDDLQIEITAILLDGIKEKSP